jgi:hypothetical protein
VSDVPVILVANRGEIAMRIIAAARRIGASPVLAASVADKDSPAARAADRVIVIGASPANQSYLKPEQVAQAAVMAGAAAQYLLLSAEFVAVTVGEKESEGEPVCVAVTRAEREGGGERDSVGEDDAEGGGNKIAHAR